MSTQTLHLVIHGRVQGVWFRESMCREAERLGVTGWVRNLPDGSVEAMVQGSTQAVDALINWSKVGPPMAHVERIVQNVVDGHFTVFEKRTA